MTKSTITGGRRAPRAAKWRKLIAELKGRHDVAFGVLNAQTEVLKANRSVQVAFGAGTVYALCTGRLVTAAGMAGAWLGSRPLCHIGAAGVACMGVLNDATKRAIKRMREDGPGSKRPRKVRRRRAKAKVTLAPAPVA